MPNQENAPLSLNERLVIALDVATVDRARALAAELADLGPIFKIGYHTLFSGGLSLAQDLARQGLKVFLDAKLHDIPQTVEGGTRALAAQGYWCMTAHAQAQNITSAVAGAAGTSMKILGVTVLTSMTDQDLTEDGIPHSAADQVGRRAAQALGAGGHGLIASPLEVPTLRAVHGSAPLIITPGVRPANSDKGDQARTQTPAEAIHAGADALVVGRPIVQASSPLDAARRILDEIANAL